MGRYVVAISGASGAAYARRLVGALCAAGQDVDLLVTAAGFMVLAHELDWDDPRYSIGQEGVGRGEPGGRHPADGGLAARCERFFRPEGTPGALRFHPIHDMMDDLASGSVAIDGMVVIPCTMGRVAALASGRSADLLERAADCALKEGRRLIVVPRETPLSLIHLRNLTALCEAGAVVMPAMPGFYHRPRSVEDVVNFVVGKVLARLDLPQTLLPLWNDLK